MYFFGEGQNRSRDKDSHYFFLPLVKRREYPGLSFSTDYAKCLILNDEILRTSRDSLSVLNKVCGSLASEEAHNVLSHIFLLSLFKCLWNPFYVRHYVVQYLSHRCDGLHCLHELLPAGLHLLSPWSVNLTYRVAWEEGLGVSRAVPDVLLVKRGAPGNNLQSLSTAINFLKCRRQGSG